MRRKGTLGAAQDAPDLSPPTSNPGDATITATDPGSLSVNDIVNFTINDSPPPVETRSVFYTLDCETGSLQQRSDVGGIPVQDGCGAQCFAETGVQQSISNIDTTGDTVRITIPVSPSGLGLTDDGSGEDPSGIFITGVSGTVASLLNNKLFRVRNISGNSFDLYFDHPIPGQMGDGIEISDTDKGRNPVVGTGLSGTGGEIQVFDWINETSGAHNGPSSNREVKVVASEVVGAETVNPRRGSFFLRSSISYTKPYDHFGGNGRKNKPRMIIVFPGVVNQGYGWDNVAWFGCSVYIPLNWVDETAGLGDLSTFNQFIDLSEDGGPSGNGLIIIGSGNPNGGNQFGGLPGAQGQWVARETFNDETISSGSHSTGDVDIWHSFGDIADDQGMWTDWIFRYRVNPRATAGNYFNEGVAGALDLDLPANSGILQIWKSTGPVIGAPGDTNYRAMTQVLNKVNTPVGGVPADGKFMQVDLRQYRFGWHHNDANARDPIWIGFDEARSGTEEQHSCNYQSVHPGFQPPP